VGVDGAVLLSTSEEHAALIQPLIKDRAGLIFDKREIPVTASHSLVYFRITGHSMGEVLPEGSLVLVDVEDKHIKDGK
ncbi:LexA family transcriptional regulator, partial [Vibrio alfacsensis]